MMRLWELKEQIVTLMRTTGAGDHQVRISLEDGRVLEVARVIYDDEFAEFYLIQQQET